MGGVIAVKFLSIYLAAALVAGACSMSSNPQGNASPTPTTPSGKGDCAVGIKWAELNAIDLNDASISDAELLLELEDSVSTFLNERAAGQKLMPEIDVLQTRLQMMATWGRVFGYQMFDHIWDAGLNRKYETAARAFNALGGQRRLDNLAAADSALMTSTEISELDTLRKAKAEVSAARYLGLVVHMKYRISTSLDADERTAGLLAEQEFTQFSTANRAALDEAAAAGAKATKDQLALLKQEKTLQNAMYKTGNVALKVGDALSALSAQGATVPKHLLPSNSKLQQKLLEFQSKIEAMADTMPAIDDLPLFVATCRQ
jgi:hypothetical protein